MTRVLDGVLGRLCETCQPAHYDNCPQCFGWGRAADGRLLVGADIDEQWPPGSYVVCPLCGGSPFGIQP